jgi:hypothetical protein
MTTQGADQPGTLAKDRDVSKSDRIGPRRGPYREERAALRAFTFAANKRMIFVGTPGV